MRYGFAIDQRTCIGCHACTVACKTEHEVPVGQFRTWVKYVEQGTFPDNSRDFAVMRCNHCTDAPCVAICPTSALFNRDDGIVDFDRTGASAARAACRRAPTTRSTSTTDTHTAAKCNFCAHRIDSDSNPACVVVCPTAVDLGRRPRRPDSRIAELLTPGHVNVRAPEQGTGPNVFYIGASTELTLEPLPHR